MDFGYFTLSDNYYKDNPRSSSEFVRDIRDQAVFAETIGMHSAWIGEHHFSTLGEPLGRGRLWPSGRNAASLPCG